MLGIHMIGGQRRCSSAASASCPTPSSRAASAVAWASCANTGSRTTRLPRAARSGSDRRQPAQPGPRRRRRTSPGQVPAHPQARRRLPARPAGRRLRRSPGSAIRRRWGRTPRRASSSSAHAHDAYGVVLDGAGQVDTAATTALRARRKRERGPLPTEPRVQRAEEST